MSTISKVAKVSTKRVSKKQQKKTTEIKEVVPEVIVDNNFTESMKEDIELPITQPEVKPITKEITKKPVPVIFAKRNEITLFIVNETNFKGFRAPINNLISWIIKNNEEINSIVSKDSTNDDKIKQLDAVKEYFIKHKTECVEKLNEFTENFKTTKRVRKQKETLLHLWHGGGDRHSCVRTIRLHAWLRSRHHHVCQFHQFLVDQLLIPCGDSCKHRDVCSVYCSIRSLHGVYEGWRF